MNPAQPPETAINTQRCQDRVFESAAELLSVLAMLCRAVCSHVAIELTGDGSVDTEDRLVPLAHR